MIQFKRALKKEILGRIGPEFGLTEADIEITYTPQPKMGDLALTLPFQLAKKLRKPPRKVAEELLPRFASLEGVVKAEIAGAGFINLFLDRGRFFRAALDAVPREAFLPQEQKIIVEHTNINPNKAAHIGHLRNACLGDSLVRCLRYCNETVEVQNYIDDTGVQVVDVVYGFMELEKKSLSEVERIPGKFDYFCWDLYAKTSAYLAEHPEAQARKAEILKAIEHGRAPEADLARHVSHRILRAHLATMSRLDVTYDVLPCESSILGLKFWEKAFDLLKAKGGISLSAEGPNAGCWVMRLEDEEGKEKVIVRSDGTVTYVGKDIAYQLWKFGLLHKDFAYEPFAEEPNHTIWISTPLERKPGAPSFGAGSKVYNVIDTRQSYLQKVVVQGLRSLKFDEQADKSVHFSYEMVALSPKSLKELGYEASAEEKDRSFLEVSGRKGLGVKADDLLDRLEAKALAEVEKRNPDAPAEANRTVARQVAAGALRYFMLKFARNSVIVFDFEEALSFEGETGPYLQYTLVRINSIFRKLEEREGFDQASLRKIVADPGLSPAALPEAEADDFWELILFASQFEEEVVHSVQSLEFSHLAKFAFALCQKFNAYYHKYPILNEDVRALKDLRILTIHRVRDVIAESLALMGIPRPSRM
jgi:arginyl-tRNA synthetase